MKTTIMTIAMASLLALTACDEGGKKSGDGDGAKADGTAKAASAEAVPVEEDFEEEAQKEISADNLDDQVSALEAEIEGG